MARPKHKANTDVCADCGAAEPGWASLNRAILLCDDCCGIHRSLGRHVSHIKSLQKSAWSTYQINMVHTLNDNGANSIWEHSLLDPTNSKVNRRKPQAKDPLHPTKADFIKAKHQQLAFILRPGKEESCTEEDLSRQLHSSVRTSNLETSLRLLAQGANPNYFYKEKGTTPMHVAARAGQALQLELLIANGGNPSIRDANGHITAEIAKVAGHTDLAERIVDCVHEVTDRLSYYVCSRKPNHRLAEHVIVPDAPLLSERNKLSVEGKNRLQMLPNRLLEELMMDVYDEVDRRESEVIWFATVPNPERCTVPFLPVNPQLSSTRNQGRQKLARFSQKEFATLIVDLLIEARRRHQLGNVTALEDPAVSALRKDHLGKCGSQMSDDEPLYDSVASDDDYSVVAIGNSGVQSQQGEIKCDHEDICAPSAKGLPCMVEVLKKQLTLSESTVRDLREQVHILQKTVERLTHENNDLRKMIQNQPPVLGTINGHTPAEPEPEPEPEPVPEPVLDIKTSHVFSTIRSSQRPASMYETREGLRKPASWSTGFGQAKRDSECLPRSNIQPFWECRDFLGSLPPSEEVTRRTEQVTRRIQELWMAMQDPTQREAFVPCAERIRVAVAELTAIFPQNPIEESVRSALRQLNGNTGRLQAECSALQRCTSDVGHMDRCLQQVRSCAYDIAKATKLLVTQFQSQ